LTYKKCSIKYLKILFSRNGSIVFVLRVEYAAEVSKKNKYDGKAKKGPPKVRGPLSKKTFIESIT